VKIIAYISSMFLAFCSVPEVLHTIEKGRNDSSWMFLVLWGLGELGFFVYVLPKKDWPLLFNYVLNIILISILIYYKF